MSGTNTTLSYATQTGGAYDWSASANWTNGNPTGNPFPQYDVSINSGPVGAVSLDDTTSQIVSLGVAGGATLDIAAGVTLTVGGAVAGSAGTSGIIGLLGSASSINVGSSSPFLNSVGLSFGGGSETLTLAAATTGSDAGAVTGFAGSDAIDFQSLVSIQSVTLSNSVLTVDGTASVGGSDVFTFNSFATAPGVTFTTTSDGAAHGTLVEAVCFVAGTRLLTPGGERSVEDLREGDELITLQGTARVTRPITWVGRMRVNLARHPHPETAAPIRIRRGAFAENIPHRDLLLSPEHCVFIDGLLVAAKCLVNGGTIVQELDQPAVTYYHIETTPHAIVLAEGLPTETYLDTGNRAVFDNAGAALMLHPEFHINAGLRCWETDACAPLATDPAVLEPIWRALADRAAVLGYVRAELPTTTEAAPRVLIGGREIAPIEADATRLVFLLPESTADATLITRFGSPADTAPYLNDHRRLGIAIRRVLLRTGTEERVIPADHPSLTQGWHPVEQDAIGSAWRWTDGCAHLPVGPLAGPTILELHLAGAMTYRLDAVPARQAA